jgi:phosphoglycerate dehydrogenase-like enzyme
MSDRPTAIIALSPVLSAGMLRATHLERLRSLCDVPDAEPIARFDEPRAERLLARADLVLSGWGCPALSADVLDRAPALRAIFHTAGTVKSHVTGACWERGLVVSSAAAANALPVAEYTLAAILFANKRVFQLQQRYRELRQFRLWSREIPDLGNHGKHVGIIGASRVGRRVIELLEPFDLEVRVSDPYLEPAEAARLGAEWMGLDELLATCDVVSLHAPALPETHHLLDRRRMALLRDGSTLINTSRGSLIDQKALEEELSSGRIFAVIDTTEPEVLPADSALYELPNVLLTPHIAGAMGDETWRLVDLALDEIERFVSGKPLQHAVHREDLERIA